MMCAEADRKEKEQKEKERKEKEKRKKFKEQALMGGMHLQLCLLSCLSPVTTSCRGHVGLLGLA